MSNLGKTIAFLGIVTAVCLPISQEAGATAAAEVRVHSDGDLWGSSLETWPGFDTPIATTTLPPFAAMRPETQFTDRLTALDETTAVAVTTVNPSDAPNTNESTGTRVPEPISIMLLSGAFAGFLGLGRVERR